MPWIQHFSQYDVQNGFHYAPGINTILIQIKDVGPEYEFIVPKYEFIKTFQFEFEDTEDICAVGHISDSDAESIAVILREAYAANHNVLVHCVAGLCRSSAVAVAGKYIGFELEDRLRLPNSLVYSKVMTALGLSFDPNKSAFLCGHDPYGMFDN